MYATLSYDVTSGTTPVDDVRQAILAACGDRERCDLLADTLICHVRNTADYLDLTKALRKVAKDTDGQCLFVLTLHSAGAPLRSNASYSQAKANAIIEPRDA